MPHRPGPLLGKHPVLVLALESGDRAFQAGARCCLVQRDGTAMLFRSRRAALDFCGQHGLAPVSFARMQHLRRRPKCN